MPDHMLPLPGLSPVSDKKVVVNFDGGLLSSDGGVLALREIEQRLRVAERMAACLKDPRDPGQITHPLDDIIRFRLLMIEAAGAELRYLPPYSPDFNPIENAFAKLKALLRKASERTVNGLWAAIGRIIDLFPPAECANYFSAAGYDAT